MPVQNCIHCGVFTSPEAGSVTITGAITNGTFCASCAAQRVRVCPGACNRRMYVGEFGFSAYLNGTTQRVCRRCYDAWRLAAPTNRCSRCMVWMHESDSTVLAEAFYCPPCAVLAEREIPRCRECGNRVRTAYIREPHICRDCYNTAFRQTSASFDRNPSRRTVGFELEYCAPDNHGAAEFWPFGHVHGDGSVHPDQRGGYGREFASYPTNGDLLLERIEAVCTMMRDRHAYANPTCGFHMHLHVGNDSVQAKENIKDWWRFFEPMFFACVEPNRRLNNYCLSVNRNPAEWSSNRYKALNLRAEPEHGTFEIRLHHGTVDPTEITAWALILTRFFDCFSRVSFKPECEAWNQRKRLMLLFRQAKMPLSLRKCLMRRMRQYNQRATTVRLALKAARADIRRAV